MSNKHAETPSDMKNRLWESLKAEREDTDLEKFNYAVESRVMDAMERSVRKGGKLPDLPISDDLVFDENITMFSNAGGMKLYCPGGIPVTVDAAKLRDSEVVTVVWKGQHVAMTVEEAFDRGLRESWDWEALTDQQTAVSYVLGNIAREAKKSIQAVTTDNPAAFFFVPQVPGRLRWRYGRTEACV